jgi:hypothetical protein
MNFMDSRVENGKFDCDKALSRLKMGVFWDAAPCILIDINRHFRGNYGIRNHCDAGSQKTKSSMYIAVRSS